MPVVDQILDPRGFSSCVNLVIDVSEVSGVCDARVGALNLAIQDIENHSWAGIAHVCEVVNGWSAHIQTDMFSICRDKLLGLTAQGVGEVKRH